MGRGRGVFVFSTPLTAQAQQHLSHFLYSTAEASPTPNPTRAQLGEPEATAKMTARSSLELWNPKSLLSEPL